MGGIFNTASRTFTTVDIPMHLLKYGGRRKFNAAVALGDYVIFSPEMAQEIGIFRVLDRSFSVVDITTSLKFDKFPGTYDTFGGAVAMGNTVIFSPSYTSAVGILTGHGTTNSAIEAAVAVEYPAGNLQENNSTGALRGSHTPYPVRRLQASQVEP